MKIPSEITYKNPRNFIIEKWTTREEPKKLLYNIYAELDPFHRKILIGYWYDRDEITWSNTYPWLFNKSQFNKYEHHFKELKGFIKWYVKNYFENVF